MGMTAPGWYPDVRGEQRYWDGVRWTEHVVPQAPVAAGATVVQGPNHVLHALLTVFTCGFWAPIWLFVALSNKKQVRYVR
jgi:hypothetical protein